MIDELTAALVNKLREFAAAREAARQPQVPRDITDVRDLGAIGYQPQAPRDITDVQNLGVIGGPSRPHPAALDQALASSLDHAITTNPIDVSQRRIKTRPITIDVPDKVPHPYSPDKDIQAKLYYPSNVNAEIASKTMEPSSRDVGHPDEEQEATASLPRKKKR